MIFESVDDFKRFILRRLTTIGYKYKNVNQYSLVNASFTNLDLSEFVIDEDDKDYRLIRQPYGYSVMGCRNTINIIPAGENLLNVSVHVEPIDWRMFDYTITGILGTVKEVFELFNGYDYNISIDFDTIYFYEKDRNLIENELALLEKELELCSKK